MSAGASRPPIGVLAVNLGSPDAPTPQALRAFLGEFLSDPRVVPLWMPRGALRLVVQHDRSDEPPEHHARNGRLRAQVRFPLFRPLLERGFQARHIGRCLPWPSLFRQTCRSGR